MVNLSVNVNKVATLRNSRGGRLPSVLDAVRTIVDAGAPGITVHPRGDARHITRQDVLDIAAALAPLRGQVEFNIEGDIRPDLMALVHQVQPDQCTLVPVLVGEVTSQGGWPIDTPIESLRGTIAGLRAAGIRVSLFIDPDPAAVRWAAELGADRVELFTEPFAQAFEAGPEATDAAMHDCTAAAETAHQLGLGVNAGHDLDHRNLVRFRELPHLDEVSIGHALVSRALFDGLTATVRAYLDVLR
ncbi:MAG: pyridoxine 5'-phosphate synthase [Vicinamibacteraceae bacterium]